MNRKNSNILILGLMLLVGIWLAVNKSHDENKLVLPKKIDFNFHIRPLLSENCFLCHGPDSSSRQANLRLDTYEGATALLENGKRAIIPGKPAKSALIQRISHSDPELAMPPPEMKKRLTEYEIGLLKKWIKQGAKWKPYWAFIPPQKPDYSSSDHYPIDYFIRKKLQKSKLSPASKADKNSLIRRLAFTLTGLPPTPEAVDQFMRDTSSQAYEKIVDQYLASPHFGERWARHWMDLVRYAETRGHEYDYPIMGAWRYRDYLIRAFNQDVPYDQFVLEHLAGDLIQNPRFHHVEGYNESVFGTAFLGFSEGKHSPVSIREEEVDRIDNMIDVTSKTFQALTVSCAKCHDHKFDPIPTTDYYAMYGMMESTRFSMVPARSTLQQLGTIDSIEQLKQQIRQLIAQPIKTALEEGIAMPIGFNNQSSSPIQDSVQVIGDFRNGTLTNWFNDGIAFGKQPEIGQPIIEQETGQLLGFEVGKASSRSLGKGLQGALRSGTFIIEHDSLLIRASGEQASLRIIIDNFQLIRWPIYGGLEFQLNSPEFKDYVFNLSTWKGHKAYVEIHPGIYTHKHHRDQYFDIPPNAWVDVQYALAFSGDKPTLTQNKNAPVNLKNTLDNWLESKTTASELALLNQWIDLKNIKITDSKYFDLVERRKNLARSLYDSTFFAGVREGDAVESPVFIRGDYKNPDTLIVPHRFLTAMKDLVDFPEEGSGRMAFAQAIIHPDNPLTARVMVNRIWHYLFGRGIVETVDNFGLQGKLPSHPELLDYLALRFIELDWSIKKLIREIVLSETFQQTTVPSDASLANDPENILLQHYPIRRLEAEAIRDAVLAVSGRLDTRLYGPSMALYLTEFMKGRGRPYQSGPLDGGGRRSIYVEVLRNFLSPMMLTFDMPIPFSTFGKRNVTNVPAQALTLMNDPFISQQAAYWAEELTCYESEPEALIQSVYQRAFSRKAGIEEIESAKTFLRQQGEIYQIDSKKIYQDKRPWADFCHAVFNMKEFIFFK